MACLTLSCLFVLVCAFLRAQLARSPVSLSLSLSLSLCHSFLLLRPASSLSISDSLFLPFACVPLSNYLCDAAGQLTVLGNGDR